MRLKVWGSVVGMVILLSGGCFADPPKPPASDPLEDEQPTTGVPVTAGGSASATADGSAESATDGPDDPTAGDDPTADTSTGEACEAGDAGCPCDDGCADGLSCVDGTCTSCGDGEVDETEECDGDVDGGVCIGCLIECNAEFADCDGDPLNGCETDLRLPASCGACGHDCLGGDCQDLVCQPVDLAQSQGQPLGLDVESGTVFWSNLTSGEINAHSVEPGGPPVLIADGLEFPETVVADGSKVYWAELNRERIGRANYDGSALESEWTAAPTVSGVRLLVTGPSHLYLMRFVDGAYRADKVTPSPAGAIPVGTGAAWGGFLERDTLYWSDPNAGQIRRADVGSGPPFAVDTVVPNAPLAYAVYVHDGVLYWSTDGTGTDGTVNAMPLEGGPPVLFTDTARFPEDIVVDDDYVYWAEWDEDGLIHRARHDGTEVTPLFPAFSAPLEQDDDAIYWVDQTGGRIRKLAKPPSPKQP